MADRAVLLSAEVEHMNEESAPNGAGFYFRIEGASDWTGPFDSEDIAHDAVMDLFQRSAADFVKSTLKL